jgi:hypothetical protein
MNTMPAGSDDSTLRIVSQFDVAGIQAGMSEAAATVEVGSKQMTASFKEIAVESEYSATEARHAFHGLGEEIGIHVPRFVQSFVANLGGVGPVLAAAFAPIAVIGLVNVLAEIPEALQKGIDKLAGWDEEAKKAFREETDEAIRLDQRTIKLHDEIAKVGLVGKTGVEKYGLELKIAGDTTRELADLQDSYNRKLADVAAGEKFAETTSSWTSRLKQGVTALFEGETSATLFANSLGHAGQMIERDKIQAEALGKAVKQLGEEIEHKQRVERPAEVAEGIEAAKRAAEQYAEEIEKSYKDVAHLVEMQDKLAEGAARFAEEQKGFGTKESDKGVEAQLRGIEELSNAEEKFRADSEQRALEAADFAIDQKIREVQVEKDQGEISLSNATSQTNSLVAQRLAADEKMLDQEMILVQSRLEQERAANSKAYAEDLTAYSQMLKKKEQLEEQAAKEMEKTDDQTAKQMLKSYENALKAITTDFNKNIIEWTNKQETFGRAMVKTWVNMVNAAESALLTLAEKEIAGMILQTSLVNQQKLNAAQTAAANTYSSVSAIPIIGPELAEPAAIAAYAAVMAFEKGGIMPDTAGLAMLHPREMVLPAPISESVQRMAAGGKGAPTPMNIHFHGTQNPADMGEMERNLTAMVKRAQRNGRIDSF